MEYFMWAYNIYSRKIYHRRPFSIFDVLYKRLMILARYFFRTFYLIYSRYIIIRTYATKDISPTGLPTQRGVFPPARSSGYNIYYKTQINNNGPAGISEIKDFTQKNKKIKRNQTEECLPPQEWFS